MTPFTSFLHLRTLCSCKWFKTAVTDETAFSIRESLCHRAGCISNVKSSSVTSLMRAFLEPGNKSQNVSFWYALRSLLVFCFQLFLFRAALGSDGRFSCVSRWWCNCWSCGCADKHNTSAIGSGISTHIFNSFYKYLHMKPFCIGCLGFHQEKMWHSILTVSIGKGAVR